MKDAMPRSEQERWAVVPVEATTGMLIAGNHGQPGNFSAAKVWSDMLDAAQRSHELSYTRPSTADAIALKLACRLAKLDISEEAMRKEFERWFFGDGEHVRPKRSGDGYSLMSAHSGWQAYRAAVQMMRERCK